VIKLVVAPGGEGKSLYVVGRCLDIVVSDRPRVIASNIPWSPYGRLWFVMSKLGLNTMAEARAFVKEWFVDLKPEQITRFWHHVPPDSIVVIDEASHYWSAWKRKADPEELHDAAREHRKMGLDVYLLTHSPKCLDAIWRYSAQSAIWVKNMGQGMGKGMKMPGTFSYWETADLNGGGVEMFSGFYRLDMKVAKAYYTKKGACAMTSKKADKGRKHKGINFYVAVPMAVAGICVMLWGVSVAVEWAIDNLGGKQKGQLATKPSGNLQIVNPEPVEAAEPEKIFLDSAFVPTVEAVNKSFGFMRKGGRIIVALENGDLAYLPAEQTTVTKRGNSYLVRYGSTTWQVE